MMVLSLSLIITMMWKCLIQIQPSLIILANFRFGKDETEIIINLNTSKKSIKIYIILNLYYYHVSSKNATFLYEIISVILSSVKGKSFVRF